MAFGGNFYALLPAADAGVSVDPAAEDELVERGLAIMAAIDAADRPVHPEDPRISGCHHVVFHQPGAEPDSADAATSIHPGWLDRSPCGHGHVRTARPAPRPRGAAARPAVRQPLGDRHGVHGRGGGGDHGRRAPAIVPEITGRAWITGRAEYVLQPDDPFPAGFRLG
jgi:proline racemase